jgi:hypothetical protein
VPAAKKPILRQLHGLSLEGQKIYDNVRQALQSVGGGTETTILSAAAIAAATGQSGGGVGPSPPTPPVVIPPPNMTYVVGPITYVIQATDQWLLCDATLGAITLLLPKAAAGRQTLNIKDYKGMSPKHNIIIKVSTGDTLDGSTLGYGINSAYKNIICQSTARNGVWCLG